MGSPDLTEFYKHVPSDMRPRSPRSGSAHAVGNALLLYSEEAQSSARGEVTRAYQVLDSDDNAETQKAATLASLAANSLCEGLDKLEDNIPILFGVTSPNRGADRFIIRGTYLFEFDPSKHGFIALCEVPFNERVEKYLETVLIDSHRFGKIPLEAEAYQHMPVRPWSTERGLFYRTILTHSDGLVWFEHLNQQDKRLSRPKIMIFPRESLKN